MDLNPLNALRARASQWAQDVKTVIDTDVPPELQAQKDALISRARTVKETLESVLGTIDELAPIGLGYLMYAIPAAAIIAAGAAVTYWYYDHDKFVKSLEAYNATISRGGTATQAAQVVAAINGNSSSLATLGFGLNLPTILIGGMILYFVLGKVRH